MTSDPDQIRNQITQTQRELSADVDALTDKLSPPRIAQRRIQRGRAAMISVKERIMGSTSSGAADARDSAASAASTARDAVSGAASSAAGTVSETASSAAGTISDAASSAAGTVGAAPEVIRRRTEGNPLAAGLIAFGVGWLISSLLPPTTTERQVAAKVKETATTHGQPAVQQLSEAAQDVKGHLGESARQAAESVRSTAADAAQTVGGRAQSAAEEVKDQAAQSRQRVSDQAKPGS